MNKNHGPFLLTILQFVKLMIIVLVGNVVGKLTLLQMMVVIIDKMDAQEDKCLTQMELALIVKIIMWSVKMA